MKIIRSFATVFFFLFFGLGACILNFLIFPVAKSTLNKTDFINFSANIIHKLWNKFIKIIELFGLIKLKINDPNALKNIENKVIAVTHPSFIDIVILIALIPKSTCFVKKSLTKNLVLKNLVNSIFIPNDISIEELKSESKKYLDLGLNMIIFPAGKRHPNNEQPKIKKGAALIALNAKKNIIPVKMTTSEEFLAAGKPFYAGSNKTVEYYIKIRDTIEIEKFINDSEIITKNNITKEISKALYE